MHTELATTRKRCDGCETGQDQHCYVQLPGRIPRPWIGLDLDWLEVIPGRSEPPARTRARDLLYICEHKGCVCFFLFRFWRQPPCQRRKTKKCARLPLFLQSGTVPPALPPVRDRQGYALGWEGAILPCTDTQACRPCYSRID